ncbi:hypothetical protein TTHERM_000095461 (macronuclear) [Tetrahymena thermophila SB210]|uniref:Uncharacterized protein n=1 Tax=Tetrahymena thermophila (strain SB210) TaxID=312017 RepID=W7XF15_TETTS|nr:hypothetical protein TTHERM_000095461 [Tetrahymena thermophila SB210]EWS75368.1 hypothetical protein TTHERM_000095461 [Tetrahymena thermophila SB210]|eukprot:XP_012652042.1 hypothetical protein TTHERM_000095461 [Tetrahymena thermophila SB210]
MINDIFRYKYAPKQNLKEKIEKMNEKRKNERFFKKIDKFEKFTFIKILSDF